MTNRHPPRLAVALLDRCVPDNEALSGDLVEEFQRGRSSLWFWRQAIGAAAMAMTKRPKEIRPLRLVDDRDRSPRPSTAKSRLDDLKPINLPLSTVGGLGLLALGGLVMVVLPQLWLVVLAAMACGVVLGLVRIVIARHARRDPDQHVIHIISIGG
jgi:hypothetical protein